MDISYRLNDVTLTHILERCRNNPEYQVVIVFNRYSRHDEFCKAIRSQIMSGRLDAIISVNVMDTTADIRFANGSNISAVHGLPIEHKIWTMHEILFDYDVNCDIIDDIQLSSYWNPGNAWFNYDDMMTRKASSYLYDFSKTMDKYGYVVKLAEDELEYPSENTSDELDRFLSEFRVEKPLRHNT